MAKNTNLSLVGHLDELRRRLFYSVLSVLVGFLVCYGFKEKLFDILTMPIVQAMAKLPETIHGTMIFIAPAEPFFVYLKAAFIAGILISAPVWLYQFWLFVSPGLYDKEKRLILPIVFLSSFFFIGGALFGYFVVFPFAFDFFMEYATPSLLPQISMKVYLDFASKLLLAFGFVFELPLVLTFLAFLGIIDVKFLTKNRKYAVLACFIIGAILTPPDVITQVLMAIPMMVLYEFGIIGAKIFGKKKTNGFAEETKESV